jgi:hypothetical protein
MEWYASVDGPYVTSPARVPTRVVPGVRKKRMDAHFGLRLIKIDLGLAVLERARVIVSHRSQSVADCRVARAVREPCPISYVEHQEYGNRGKEYALGTHV